MSELIVTETSKALSKELLSLESKIRTAQKSFLVEGECLNAIMIGELYLERGFATFDSYVDQIFDISTNYAYKRAAAWRVWCILKDSGFKGKQLPKTESQCRPLTKLNGDDKPELQKLIIPTWEAVLAHDCRITAKLIESEVNKALGKGEPVKPPETPSEKPGENPEVPDEKPETPTEIPAENPEMPNGEGADTLMNDSAELAFLRCKVADLEMKLAAERAKKAGGVPNSKLARDLIQAGFKALAPTLDDEGKKELLDIKKTMLGL